MIKIHPNILIGSPPELQQVLPSVNFIINCSMNLNNLIVHPNYINLNISIFNQETLTYLNNLYNFIVEKICSNQNIFLLCETGINNSLIIGMFIIMKMFNLNYNQVYYTIANSHRINSYDFYTGLKFYEIHIISNFSENMDLT